MRKKFVAAVAAALVVLVVSPTGAETEPPADVDCGVLESTLLGIDEQFDLSSGGAVGELLAGLLTDPTSFNSFNGLVFAFSGGTISFTSGPELVATLGKCQLMPLLVSLING